MYLNSISLITSEITGEQPPRPIPTDWHKRMESDLCGADLDDIILIGEKIWGVYRAAQLAEEGVARRSLLRSVEFTKVVDLARLVLCREKTYAEVAKALSLEPRAVRHSKSSVEMWFNTTFIYKHPHAYGVFWWAPTRFGRKIWHELEDIVMMWANL